MNRKIVSIVFTLAVLTAGASALFAEEPVTSLNSYLKKH